MKFWLIVLGIISGVGLGIFYLLGVGSSGDLSIQQKQQALEKLLGYTPRLTTTQKIEWTEHTGKLIHLLYPENAHIFANASTSATVIDSFSYTVSNDHVLVSTQVKNSPDAIDDDSGVQMRQQSENYIEEITGDASCKKFIKKSDGVEEGEFCIKNGKLGSIVITGQNEEVVQKYFSILFSQFSW